MAEKEHKRRKDKNERKGRGGAFMKGEKRLLEIGKTGSRKLRIDGKLARDSKSGIVNSR